MSRARVTLALFLVIPAAFAWACGGADNTDIDAGDGGGNDGTVGNDTGPGKDGSSNDSSSNDTGTNDTGTNDTGTTDGGGGDGASSFACTKPSDCTNQFCCGTVVFNGGTLPNCTLEDASSACSSTCVSNIQFSCKATDTLRTCATNTDCADAGAQYNKCCNVKFGDAGVDFCWNAQFAGAAGGTCQ